jgi:hypothetical protein
MKALAIHLTNENSEKYLQEVLYPDEITKLILS